MTGIKSSLRKRAVQQTSVQQDMDNCFGFDEEDEDEDDDEIDTDEMSSKTTVHILQPAMH